MFAQACKVSDIGPAQSRNHAEARIDAFVEKCRIERGPAVDCLIKDRPALLACYGFPAEHQTHFRTILNLKASSRWFAVAENSVTVETG